MILMFLTFSLCVCWNVRSERGIRFDMYKWLTDLDIRVCKVLSNPLDEEDGDDVFKDITCYNGYLYHLTVTDSFNAPIEKEVINKIKSKNPDGPQFSSSKVKDEVLMKTFNWNSTEIDELKRLVAETTVLWDKAMYNFYKTKPEKSERLKKVFI